VPGHWEGDLLFGKGMTAIATLVERHSRFVLLIALPEGHRAELVTDALAARITTLPVQLRRSITWDQGKEMAQHARFSVDTGVTVYFCDPRSPWQRESNENTNGLLRQYFPKRSDLRTHTQADLDAVAAELNDRPRQTLGWRSPSEALDDALRRPPETAPDLRVPEPAPLGRVLDTASACFAAVGALGLGGCVDWHTSRIVCEWATRLRSLGGLVALELPAPQIGLLDGG
jgi:hypothetical protein